MENGPGFSSGGINHLFGVAGAVGCSHTVINQRGRSFHFKKGTPPPHRMLTVKL